MSNRVECAVAIRRLLACGLTTRAELHAALAPGVSGETVDATIALMLRAGALVPGGTRDHFHLPGETRS